MSPDEALSLLLHFNFNYDKLKQSWLEQGPQTVRKEAGVTRSALCLCLWLAEWLAGLLRLLPLLVFRYLGSFEFPDLGCSVPCVPRKH